MSSTQASASTSSAAVKVVLPDLVSHCDFKLRLNSHVHEAAPSSEKWMVEGAKLSAKKIADFRGLKAGLLTSMCYPDADLDELRVCCDFMYYLFHLDELTDDMEVHSASTVANVVMNALYFPDQFDSNYTVDTMTRSYWRRLIKTGSAGAQQRFMETMEFFFQAVAQQAIDRKRGLVPDLESYISLRRDTSGCKPCWALIEYANNLDIPDEVMESPSLLALGEAANDLVTWSNDIFSYNVEQARGDTHNMICVVMREQGLSLQEAVDFVGDMCKQSIDRFIEEREHLPSWSPSIDKDVDIYVEGLANWIVGSLHWSFLTERYFGKSGMAIKKQLVLELAPLELKDKSQSEQSPAPAKSSRQRKRDRQSYNAAQRST